MSHAAGSAGKQALALLIASAVLTTSCADERYEPSTERATDCVGRSYVGSTREYYRGFMGAFGIPGECPDGSRCVVSSECHEECIGGDGFCTVYCEPFCSGSGAPCATDADCPGFGYVGETCGQCNSLSGGSCSFLYEVCDADPCSDGTCAYAGNACRWDGDCQAAPTDCSGAIELESTASARDALCDAEYPGSFVCTEQELVESRRCLAVEPPPSPEGPMLRLHCCQ